MKKLAVIGRGTAGAFAVSHFLKHTDWDIEWHFDPSIKPQAVGEGSTLDLPGALFQNLGFNLHDLEKIYGTFKAGIKKQGWGKDGRTFSHLFPPGQVGYHFNAVKLQEHIFEKVRRNPRIKFIENNIIDHNAVDSDFIMDCSGKPDDLKDFIVSEYIPVNSVYVTQCYWDIPKFQYTLAIARPYGWVFGIPLRNRCSIGYMYNGNISTIEEVKEDVKEIFKAYNLTPSQDTNSFSFGNYFRKRNFTERVVYNGNASFFLEPLEATSIFCMNSIQFTALSMWRGGAGVEEANTKYIDLLNCTENIIMMHYYKNGTYDTPFWNHATERGESAMKKAFEHGAFREMIQNAVDSKYSGQLLRQLYGSWDSYSFIQNVNNLDIGEDLLNSM